MRTFSKFLKLLSFLLILTFFPINKSFAGKYGTGELKLTRGTVDHFIEYIRGAQNKFPADFYVTVDGTDSIRWFCRVKTNCSEGSIVQDLADCLRSTGKECKKFARQRIIRWQNGINPGKGKISKINSKWSDEQIIDKLVELGFYSR